jgi:hypothetical protein
MPERQVLIQYAHIESTLQYIDTESILHIYWFNIHINNSGKSRRLSRFFLEVSLYNQVVLDGTAYSMCRAKPPLCCYSCHIEPISIIDVILNQHLCSSLTPGSVTPQLCSTPVCRHCYCQCNNLFKVTMLNVQCRCSPQGDTSNPALTAEPDSVNTVSLCQGSHLRPWLYPTYMKSEALALSNIHQLRTS